MAFFTKSGGSAADTFTFARITAALDAHQWNYGVNDEATEAFGRWDGHPFTFQTSGKEGETLYVRARWLRDIPESEYNAVLEIANQWHSDTHWPKIVVRKFDDGTLGVFGELSVNYRTGVTDEMLGLHLEVAIGTAGGFFDKLDEAYPEAAAVAKAKEEAESGS